MSFIYLSQRQLQPSVLINYLSVLKNRIFQTCVIVKRTCILIFSKLGLADQSKPCTLIYCQKKDKLHKFATTNSNFEIKSIILDMHHHKTYMYIHFQQNWVNRSVITVRTNLFANITSCINLQLPMVIFKNRVIQTCIIVKRTRISIFSKIGFVDQSKPCTQIYL